MHPDGPTSDGGFAPAAPAPARRLLAVSGWQASGKTTLLVGAIGELRARGLSVAVVKHDAHGIVLDVEGKDSDRLFRAGADVTLDGAEERFQRNHPEQQLPIELLIERLERRYDLVLVEGHRSLPIPRVWLLGAGETEPPAAATRLIASLPPEGRDARFVDLVLEHLTAAWAGSAVRAGLIPLADGAPAHEQDSQRELAACGIDSVLVLGSAAGGAIPLAPGSRGLSGALRTALRWDPDAAWLLLDASVRPAPTRDAVRWLLEQRRPGTWAVMPRSDERRQPLPALFEPQTAALVDALCAPEDGTLQALVEHPRVRTPEPPSALLACWSAASAAS